MSYQRHPCIREGCHTEPVDILIHGQVLLFEQGELIMATVTQVQADFDAYKANVDQFITDAQAAFARLQASIDANTLDPAALQALDDAINGDNAAVLAADSDANAKDQPPVETPPAE